ncbi:hypothetical protein PAPYR_1626 [Paratrimastix pyriformis]|uniref:Uncharacterized protein n=1 Tax=Paratrimastix pyriformis TaxID=342808 RepID=A0ABQ8UW06_9EUKA|nr:hypothetical protein PAPYR_1626 [Paratrimastix pyriformis]
MRGPLLLIFLVGAHLGAAMTFNMGADPPTKKLYRFFSYDVVSAAVFNDQQDPGDMKIGKFFGYWHANMSSQFESVPYADYNQNYDNEGVAVFLHYLSPVAITFASNWPPFRNFFEKHPPSASLNATITFDALNEDLLAYLAAGKIPVYPITIDEIHLTSHAGTVWGGVSFLPALLYDLAALAKYAPAESHDAAFRLSLSTSYCFKQLALQPSVTLKTNDAKSENPANVSYTLEGQVAFLLSNQTREKVSSIMNALRRFHARLGDLPPLF